MEFFTLLWDIFVRAAKPYVCVKMFQIVSFMDDTTRAQNAH